MSRPSPAPQDALRHVRGILRRFTTPLLPDDYTQLINPLWSARELRGVIVSATPATYETPGDPQSPPATITLVIKPGWGVPVHFAAGQYIGIGVPIDGRYTWRSYSLTCPPNPRDGLLEITVRAVERGKLSNHLVGGAHPGMQVRLAAPAGEFHLSDPLPPKLLFVTAGTGITPIISMLRSLEDRATAAGQDSIAALSDIVLVHSARTAEDVLYRADLERWASKGVSVHINLTSEAGRVTPERLVEFAADAPARVVYCCGPRELLDAMDAWAQAHQVELKTERFSIDRTSTAQGGTIEFGSRGCAEVDGATTILEAGESLGVQLPFGCRMGICQTCVQEVAEGYVVDLRSGETKGPGERVRTCVCVAAGDVRLNL